MFGRDSQNKLVATFPEGARANKAQGQKRPAPSSVSRATSKKPLLEQTFNTEKEKHQRWSWGLKCFSPHNSVAPFFFRNHFPSQGNEIKKELKDIAGFLVDMPKSSDLTNVLKKHQRSLKAFASRLLGLSGNSPQPPIAPLPRFKELKTFQDMEPACAEIAEEATHIDYCNLNFGGSLPVALFFVCRPLELVTVVWKLLGVVQVTKLCHQQTPCVSPTMEEPVC